MENFYNNLSDAELLKKRAMGSEAITPEAHKIIVKILTERGVHVPPLYEKPIDMEQMTEESLVKNKSTSLDYFSGGLWIAGTLVLCEVFKEVLKHSGFLVNVITMALTFAVWLSINSYKKGIPVEGELGDKVGKDGFNELMKCSVLGDVERTKEILSYRPNVNKADEKGYTSLMYASSNGKKDVVELLLANGADKNISTIKGNTALSFAKKNNHEDVVKILT